MDVLELLQVETGALVRTVDSLEDADLDSPSSLPGWSRAHLVAHLALNAEGLSRAVEASRRHTSVPQYPSDEARTADIESLAGAGPDDLRSRFLASTTVLGDALASVGADGRDAVLERSPGGTRFTVAQVPAKRLTEVVLHHVDLDVGRSRHDATALAAATVVDVLVPRLERLGPRRLRATDLDRAWGPAEGPEVRGRAADLAWWLSGRGSEGLTGADGVAALPPW